MSMLDVLLQQDSAFVGVDTCLFNFATGQTHEGTKLLAMPGSGVVVANTGTPDVLFHFAMSFNQAAKTVDFDAIREHFTQFIDAWFDKLCSFYPPEVSPRRGGQRIVVVGWSKRDAAMRGLQFHRQAGDGKFEITDIDGCLSTPAYDEDLSELVVPDHFAYMRAIADARMRDFRGMGSEGQRECPIGGKLIVAMLTREGTTIRNLGEL